MKIGGQEVVRCVEFLVLPRESGDLVIKAQSVAINDEFDKLVGEPTAPGKRTKEGFSRDLKDKTYLQEVEVRDSKRWDYMILRSLEPSNIEWEKVDLDKPNTWGGWKKELIDAGLSEIEVNRIVAVTMAANSLDEGKLKKARENFLLGQGQ